MRISDWSSDVCSSDLRMFLGPSHVGHGARGGACSRRGNGRNWSGRQDSNLRHPAPKAGALPGCATPRTADALRFHALGEQAERTAGTRRAAPRPGVLRYRSEEHTSELQSLMRISYAVFCLKKNNNTPTTQQTIQIQ